MIIILGYYTEAVTVIQNPRNLGPRSIQEIVWDSSLLRDRLQMVE
jgi:hypothetical protein